MPSPFPGMDPYLEGSQWTSVHAELCVEIARQLAPRLQPRHVARTNERFVVTMPESENGVTVSTASVYPGASISDAGASAPTWSSGAGTFATVPPPLRVATVMPES